MIEVPWNLVVPEADVYLVGFGNRFPNDFTLEMVAVLQRCRRVFGAPPLCLTGYGIPAMDSVMHLFRRGRDRAETYREIADLVLDAGAGTPPVAFATYGSAMVGMPASHDILQRAVRRGLSTHVSNAVSCLDGIWADLNLDPCGGCAIWEAATLLDLGVVPDPRADLLVPQVPLLAARGDRDPVAALRDHLLRFYPADHRVHYVRTRSDVGSPGAAAAPLRLGDLADPVDLVDPAGPVRDRLATLLVPRAHAPA